MPGPAPRRIRSRARGGRVERDAYERYCRRNCAARAKADWEVWRERRDGVAGVQGWVVRCALWSGGAPRRRLVDKKRLGDVHPGYAIHKMMKAQELREMYVQAIRN